jgi:peptidoglycan/xylan/chitin deacetylase (PgdA/CDA1 family)
MIMERRFFIRTTILGGLAAGLNSFTAKSKTHILTLSFDDGFKKSFYQTANIFERYNLRACLNVIASGHLSNFSEPNNYHKDLRGDFNDWNALQKRGHEIMPHTWDHSHVIKLPPQEAKEDMLKCLQYFEENLDKDETTMKLSAEKIIRAYDPCMSCATNFLKINWLKK